MEVPGRIKERSIYDDVNVSSAEVPDLLCQPCLNDGDVIAASGYCKNCEEYFCADCLKYHRKQTISKQHSILEGERMPSDTTTSADDGTIKCSKHSLASLRYYCRIHDEVACSECKSLDHKTCNVSLIHENSNDYLQSGELKEIHEKIDQMDKDIKRIKNNIDARVKLVNVNHEEILDDIRAFRKEVNDHLDSMESEILLLTDRSKKDKEKFLYDLEQSCVTLEKELENKSKELQVQSSNNECFVRAKLVKKRLVDLSHEIALLEQKSKIPRNKYTESPTLRTLIDTDTVLGAVTTDVLTRDDSDSDPTYVGEIDLKQENEIACNITDAVMVEPNKAILVDRNNTCIKVVDIQQSRVVSVFNTDNRPFGIAIISHDLVVITVPAAQKLQFLSYNTELTERFAIQVKGDCVGIAKKNNLLALTYNLPSKIEILTVTGTILHSIKFENLQIPSYIVFGQEPKTMFLSNYNKKKVIKLDFDGKILSTYQHQDLSNPTALMLTNDGNILVCNSGDKGNSLHVISAQCEKVGEMLQHDDHVEFPTKVLFCENSRRFYVCNGIGSLIKNSNALKIYEY